MCLLFQTNEEDEEQDKSVKQAIVAILRNAKMRVHSKLFSIRRKNGRSVKSKRDG